MGAAWREVKDGPAFDRVVEMVRGVKDLGLEACVTLGMLDEKQAKKLAEMFRKNFEKFGSNVSPAIAEAGPKA